MNDITAYMDEKVKCCKAAQREWNRLVSALKMKEREYIILFTGTEREVNYHGMRYLDTFLQRVGGSSAVILTHDPFVKKEIQNYSDRVRSIVDCDRKQAERFIDLYELYMFDERLIIISLDEPFCRKADGLVGVKGTTTEQLIAVGVYSIIPFRPLKPGNKII